MRRPVSSKLAAIAAALAALGCGSTGEEPAAASGGGGGLLTGAGGAGGQGPAATATTAPASGATGAGGAGGAEKLGPPYPIVLAHGFFGFEEFAGIDYVTYFHGVKQHLAESAGEEVHTPAVDPFNDSTYRGAQLVVAIEAILAETGHAKVNLIGHSQGGLDARVVAHDRPDLVASVTTFATPHLGTPIADIAMQLLDDPQYQAVLDWIVQVVGAPLYDEIGEATSLAAPMYLFSQPGIAEFNAKYTDSPGIPYLSLTGRSDFHFGGPACDPDTSVPFIASFETELDPIDPLLDLTEAILDGGLGNPYPNDGLVRAADARWGEFLGCVPADHLDEIGHLVGDSPGLGNSWGHEELYAALIAELRSRGF